MRTLLILVFSFASLAVTTAEAQRFRGTIYGRRGHIGHIGRHYGHHARYSYRHYGIGHHHRYRSFYPSYAYSRIRSYYVAPRAYITPYFYSAPRYYAPRYYAPIYDPFCSPYSAYGFSNWFYAATQPRPLLSSPILNSYASTSPAVPARAPLPDAAPAIPYRDERSRELGPGETELVSTVARLRNSNLQARTLARSFLATGDRLFREQRYHEALQKYKTATKAAPDLAEAQFRQGHGYIATNRYEQAAKSFKLGALLAADVKRDGFKLDDLYADSPISKTAHLDALAEETLDNVNNSDLLFLVGVFLYYDGQADRADRFFGEAARVSPHPLKHLAKYQRPTSPLVSDPLVTAFLPGEVGR